MAQAAPGLKQYKVQGSTTAQAAPRLKQYKVQSGTTAQAAQGLKQYKVQSSTPAQAAPGLKQYKVQSSTTAQTAPGLKQYQVPGGTSISTLGRAVPQKGGVPWPHEDVVHTVAVQALDACLPHMRQGARLQQRHVQAAVPIWRLRHLAAGHAGC